MAREAIRYAENRSVAGFEYDKHGKWQGPFFFIQGSDTQLGMINDYIEQKPETPNWEQEIELTNRAVAAANAMEPKPKFFIVCGDLVHALTNEKNREGQERDFKACFSRLNPEIPLLCVCGNHDINNTPTRESIEFYRKSFGDDYFSFWVHGVKGIVLNSQLYFDDSQAADLRVAMDQWLDEELDDLKSRDAKHVIIFQHIGLFMEHVDEEDMYFNLPSKVRHILVEKFQKAGVKFVFCGHYHRNAGGTAGSLNCVITSAIGGQLGQDKSGFRLVKVLDDVISHKYYALEDVPTTVDLEKVDF